MDNSDITIFFAGDVMTGRGIDQILRHPVNPKLYEPYVKDARDYITLAERKHGEIPRSVAGDYLWQEIACQWQKRTPLVKVINLETAITQSNQYWPDKGINYRMHPRNIDALTSASFDVCTLANNHILDWQQQGLLDTIDTLQHNSIAYAGAGSNEHQAQAPAILELTDGTRLLIFSMGCLSSGINSQWQATETKLGVYLLPDLEQQTITELKNHFERYQKKGDLIICSIHWGGNWGYNVPDAHRDFARRLLDQTQVSVIHGHSSHHPLALEIYKQKPILYGCGDFMNDYEGISGHQDFRPDLSLMYFVTFSHRHHLLQEIELVPVQINKFQLHHASHSDSVWLTKTLNRISARFDSQFTLNDEQSIKVATTN